MKKRWFRLIGSGVLAVLLVAGCATQTNQSHESAPKTEQQTASPEQAYQNRCASCHGGNLQGGFGPALNQIGAKLSKEEILAVIQKGKGSMPAQGHVPKEEQEKLAEWLANQK